MKKRKLLSGIMILLALALCGCGAEKGNDGTTGHTADTTTETTKAITETRTETTTETTGAVVKTGDIFSLPESQEYYEKLYGEILDYNYKLIAGGIDSFDYGDGTTGIGEVVRNDGANAMNTIGYTFVDSNLDGEVELVIGSINEENNGKCYGQLIFSSYTYKEEPVLILEGWSRNRCSLLDDGTYFTEGSNGAMYSVFENKQLEKNGTELINRDYYFTYEKDNNMEIGYYHNLTGQWDKAVSEEISETEYMSSFNGYSSRMLNMELKPFAQYEYSKAGAETGNEAKMNISWAGDKANDNTLPVFEADASEPQVAVIVSPDADVYNFKVLSLNYQNIDDAGNPVFATTDLYQQEVLAGGVEFVIKLTMYGTIPNYGISYEDASGKVYCYGLAESGMDGSALLTAIKKAE